MSVHTVDLLVHANASGIPWVHRSHTPFIVIVVRKDNTSQNRYEIPAIPILKQKTYSPLILPRVKLSQAVAVT